MGKIYFCGSIRGGRELASTYETLIKQLQVHGRVLTEHLGDDNEIQSRDRVLSDRAIHDRDLQWIRESDVVVAMHDYSDPVELRDLLKDFIFQNVPRHTS